MTVNLPVSQWRVLWFSPNAGLWQASQLEHELANGLVQRDAQVTVIRCRGMFNSYCPTMQSNGVTVDSGESAKKSVCNSCRREAEVYEGAASYSTIWLDDYLNPEMRSRVNSRIKRVTTTNWRENTTEEIAVGIYSTYLSMLHHKVSDVTATTESWNEYLSDLRNALYAAESMPQIFAETQPTHCVVYNPLYPTNRVFTELALKDPQIQFVGISAPSYVPDRFSTIALYRSIKSSQTVVDSKTLIKSSLDPLSRLEIKLVARQIGQLVRGSDPWVYSTPPTEKPTEEIRQILGIENELPVCVVLIGSPDETRSSALVGAEFERVPIEEISSVQEFIEQSLEVAGNCPDINFIFRVHPRLAPNKRESLRSPDLDAIEELLADRPSNVIVNSPHDGIGLYDVARIANFGINHASSAGLEFLALGIPVIHYDPPRLNAYPPSLGFEVPRLDQNSFHKAITQAQSKPISAGNAVLAWRWYAVTLLRAVTHKSWTNQPPNVQHQKIPRLQWLRQLLPAGFRERVSRIRSENRRAKELDAKSTSTTPLPWIDECIMRIADFDDSIIWNPKAIMRGDSLSIAEEVEQVSHEVQRICEIIGSGGAT